MKIEMSYTGRVLSVNSYKVRIGKRITSKTRPEVTAWMKELASKVREGGLSQWCDESALSSQHLQAPSLTISLYGKFYDGRVPDLANLHKVIGDAVAMGLGVDDRNFKFIDLGYSTGWVKPVLEITIETSPSRNSWDRVSQGTDIVNGKGGF
jgi:hypothetical protein